jgi:hypothetical protein
VGHVVRSLLGTLGSTPAGTPVLLAMSTSASGNSVGKLVDMKWKIGVASASNLSDQINTPYVTLALKIADNEGKISDVTMELTIAEFQVCIATLLFNPLISFFFLFFVLFFDNHRAFQKIFPIWRIILMLYKNLITGFSHRPPRPSINN